MHRAISRCTSLPICYVALVVLTYGVNQGVGEALLFTAQTYFFTDDLALTPARYSSLDGFTGLPWQVKALYGMLSDAVPLCGLHRAPYMVGAGTLGVVAAFLLFSVSAGLGAGLAATLLIGANLSIAMPDVMIDASVAERAKTHPRLTADMQSLCWGSLYFFSLFSYVGVGHVYDRVGSEGLFALFALTSLAMLVPAAAGWIGERRRPGRGGGAAAAETASAAETRPIFLSAIAVAATSTLVGNLQAFYLEDDADAVVGGVTVATGAALAGLIYVLLRRVSPELAGGATYIFLSGTLQPYTNVMFYWYHDDGEAHGNCAAHCPIVNGTGAPDPMCGYARAEGYPCLSADFYGYMKAFSKFAGLLGVFAYNRYLSRLPYRKVFSQYQVVYVFANLLDFVWVSRVNVALGVPDTWFLAGADLIQQPVSMLLTMPMFAMAARLCPQNVEATLFALLMGLSNFGGTIGGYNGAALLHIFGGVTAPEFKHLPSFIFARTIMYLLPIALVPVFVPKGSPVDGLEDAPEKFVPFDGSRDVDEGRDEAPLRPGDSSANSSEAPAKDAPAEWSGGEVKEMPGRVISDDGDI